MASILVVEDEPGIALGIEDSLRLEGHDVELIGDGVTAACRARQQEFDLILLDVMLPGKSGFEVCRELRRAGTANSDHPSDRKRLSSGIESSGSTSARTTT